MKNDLTNFIIDLSKKKNEPQWMLDFRLKSYEAYKNLERAAADMEDLSMPLAALRIVSFQICIIRE